MLEPLDQTRPLDEWNCQIKHQHEFKVGHQCQLLDKVCQWFHPKPILGKFIERIKKSWKNSQFWVNPRPRQSLGFPRQSLGFPRQSLGLPRQNLAKTSHLIWTNITKTQSVCGKMCFFGTGWFDAPETWWTLMNFAHHTGMVSFWQLEDEWLLHLIDQWCNDSPAYVDPLIMDLFKRCLESGPNQLSPTSMDGTYRPASRSPLRKSRTSWSCAADHHRSVLAWCVGDTGYVIFSHMICGSYFGKVLWFVSHAWCACIHILCMCQ